jgi:hypothetical protein
MEKRTEDLILRHLEDIARSLRILSGREDNIRVETRKDTYKDKYFAKSE